MDATNQAAKPSLITCIGRVLQKPSYIVLVAVSAYVLLLVASWLPNFALFRYVVTSPAFDFFSKLSFVFGLKGLGTNATIASLVLLFIVALLTGINIALLISYMKSRVALEKTAGTSALGIIVALLGVGCASCGSVILTTLFGVGATAGIVSFLPLSGLEFMFLAAVILLFSIYTVAKKIRAPLVC